MPAPPTSRGRVVSRLCGATCSAVLLLVPASWAFVPAPPGSPARANALAGLTSEYQIKAEVLSRIARYTRWPDSAFADKNTPFVIAVLGKDPFGNHLENAFEGQRIADRRIVFVRTTEAVGLGNAQLVFVAGRDEKVQEKSIAHFAGQPVLLVTDTLRGAELGAQVGFYLESQRLRFAISTGSAKKAGLEMSSELLKLAKIVALPSASGEVAQ
ncbi:MAG: YfiR family protein [Planctomycetes bacterium]|nr:YfiR family protein [Planctomycetota bacterium]